MSSRFFRCRGEIIDRLHINVRKGNKYSRNRTRNRRRTRLRSCEKSCATVAVNPGFLFKLVPSLKTAVCMPNDFA